MHDALVCGRRFRTFNVVDDFNREALAIEIDLNIPAQRVVRVLDRIVANRGYPLKLRMDNGPELVSLTLAQWAKAHGVMQEFIKPGTVAYALRTLPLRFKVWRSLMNTILREELKSLYDQSLRQPSSPSPIKDVCEIRQP